MRISDWSSDVCSSDLPKEGQAEPDPLVLVSGPKHYAGAVWRDADDHPPSQKRTPARTGANIQPTCQRRRWHHASCGPENLLQASGTRREVTPFSALIRSAFGSCDRQKIGRAHV